MKHNTTDCLTRREQAQLDRHILRGSDDLRGSAIDRLADDIAKVDGAEPEIPPALRGQLNRDRGDLVREIERGYIEAETPTEAEQIEFDEREIQDPFDGGRLS